MKKSENSYLKNRTDAKNGSVFVRSCEPGLTKCETSFHGLEHVVRNRPGANTTI
jgi:hypothetical protein